MEAVNSFAVSSVVTTNENKDRQVRPKRQDGTPITDTEVPGITDAVNAKDTGAVLDTVVSASGVRVTGSDGGFDFLKISADAFEGKVTQDVNGKEMFATDVTADGVTVFSLFTERSASLKCSESSVSARTGEAGKAEARAQLSSTTLPDPNAITDAVFVSKECSSTECGCDVPSANTLQVSMHSEVNAIAVMHSADPNCLLASGNCKFQQVAMYDAVDVCDTANSGHKQCTVPGLQFSTVGIAGSSAQPSAPVSSNSMTVQ